MNHLTRQNERSAHSRYQFCIVEAQLLSWLVESDEEAPLRGDRGRLSWAFEDLTHWKAKQSTFWLMGKPNPTEKSMKRHFSIEGRCCKSNFNFWSFGVWQKKWCPCFLKPQPPPLALWVLIPLPLWEALESWALPAGAGCSELPAYPPPGGKARQNLRSPWPVALCTLLLSLCESGRLSPRDLDGSRAVGLIHLSHGTHSASSFRTQEFCVQPSQLVAEAPLFISCPHSAATLSQCPMWYATSELKLF